MRRFGFVLAAAMIAAPIAAAAAVQPPAKVAAAVADTANRTPDNVKLDESRKPAALLQFFGLKSGMQVLDLFGGNRYWAEIMAPAVGPRGHVTVWNPTTTFFTDERRKAFDAFAERQKNISLLTSMFNAPNLPKSSYDFAIINLDYHDLYWQKQEFNIPRSEPNVWLKTLYAAMKPGGVVGLVDHVALPNSDTRATVEKLHRIDPNVVKADFKRAGFVLVGTSNLLHNPADDHSLLVFDPKIRGKTDRFVMKFRKVR